MMKPDTPKFALLPCPFCGGRADYEQCEGKVAKEIRWSIGCQKDTEGTCHGYQALTTYPTKTAAAKAWNTRAMISAAPKPDCVGVEEMERAFLAGWQLSGEGHNHEYTSSKINIDEKLKESFAKFMEEKRLLAVKEKAQERGEHPCDWQDEETKGGRS